MTIDGFQPAHAARAHLLRTVGRRVEATIAYDRAIALTIEPQVRRWLAARRDEPISQATTGAPGDASPSR